MSHPTDTKPVKPLGGKAYGSIPHLPGSRRGPANHGLSNQQAALLTVKTRDKHDTVFVQEKLDGSCVSVAKIGGELFALSRAGYMASTSKYEQHRLFDDWVSANRSLFASLLEDGERVVGEWLAQAHGTRYVLKHGPFVAFDIMQGSLRYPYYAVSANLSAHDLPIPKLLHCGSAISIEDVLSRLEPSGHGAVGLAEGAVWRMERKGSVDFLGKYVRQEKVDGEFLPEKTGGPAVWNWPPSLVS